MKSVETKQVLAGEMAKIVPNFIRHMYPYIFEPINVSPSQILAMLAIQDQSGCTLSVLKKEMRVSAPTVSGIIDRLVRDKYVKRSVDNKDRRVKNVVLTKKGDLVLENFRSNIFKRWQGILLKMSLKDAQSMVNTLKGIIKGFSDGSI